jgi:type I restriction enzyme M protein
LALQKEINRLTFEKAIGPEGDGPLAEELAKEQERLTELNEQISPLQKEIEQLSRQFWVSSARVKQNKYDLSASRYRMMENDEEYHEKPQVTLERLSRLEEVMGEEIEELGKMLE